MIFLTFRECNNAPTSTALDLLPRRRNTAESVEGSPDATDPPLGVHAILYIKKIQKSTVLPGLGTATAYPHKFSLATETPLVLL
jgi:hypothetical protein